MKQIVSRPFLPLFWSLIVVGFLAALILFGFNAWHSKTNQIFTVTGKEAVKSGDSSKYLIFTNVTTYEVEDSWLFWRWDSSDVYGRLTVGSTYRATLQGYRIPFLSFYPNIIAPIVIERVP